MPAARAPARDLRKSGRCSTARGHLTRAGVPVAEQGQPVKRPPSLGDLFWVGTACAIAVVAGGGIGYLLDAKLGTLPWLTVGGLAFGVVSAVLIAVKELRKYL